jgi:hypothetical protein
MSTTVTFTYVRPDESVEWFHPDQEMIDLFNQLYVETEKVEVFEPELDPTGLILVRRSIWANDSDRIEWMNNPVTQANNDARQEYNLLNGIELQITHQET